MLSITLAAALLAAPIQYQVKTFETQVDDEGMQTGQLTPSELTCLASNVTNFHTGERAVDVLWVDYIREYSNRSNVCVRWAMERHEPVSEFILRENEPESPRFDQDGETVHYMDVLPASCVPRGQAVAITGCLSSYLRVPGLVTHLSARRQRTTDPMVLRFAWERVSREPWQYTRDRRLGVARSHVRELPPPLLVVEP